MNTNHHTRKTITVAQSRSRFPAPAWLVLIVALLCAATGMVHAATWTSQAGGNWNDPLNWADGQIAAGTGDTADFSPVNVAGGSYTVTLDASVTVGNLVFGGASDSPADQWMLAGSGGSSLTLAVVSGSPAITLSGASPGVDVTIGAPILGSQGFTKAGQNTLTLTGPNWSSGTTMVAAGTLKVQSDGGLGGGAVSVADAAVLTLESGVVNNYLNDSSSLILAGSAVVNLAFTGTPDTVAALSFDGGATFQATGIWGAIGSGATHEDARFQGSGTLNVSQAAQSIIFAALADKTYGDASFTVSAGASSGLPVSFSIVSGPATIADATVTLKGAGTVTVRASQGGNINFLAAADVDQSFLVAPAPVTGSITAGDKVYDGTPAATIASRSLTGVLNGDDVSLTSGTASFLDKQVADGKPVEATDLGLGGAAAGSYVLTSTTAGATASITPLALAVSATGVDKTYDATLAATVVLSDNHLAGDDVTGSYTLAQFADKTAAPGKVVSVSGITLSGNDAGNYAANTTASTTAAVTTRPLLVTAAGVDKTYDATLAASVVLSDNHLAGDDVTDSYTLAQFADKTAAPAKAVSVSGITISGIDAGNYAANTMAGTTAAITTRPLLVSATGVNKPYDGTATASVVLSDNHLAGDEVSDSYTTALFADQNAGGDKLVTVSGIAISGADAGNYTANTSATATASILSGVLTVTADDQSRAYGAADPVLTASFSGFQNGDTAGVVSGAPVVTTLAEANSPVSETPYAITVAAGNLGAANYSFAFVPGNLTVTQAVLTVTAGDRTKVYGSANPELTAGYSGFANDEGTEVLTTLAGVTTTATDFSPVAGYLITASGVVASNYAAVYVAGTLNVTPAPVTGSITAGDKAYDGTLAATIVSRSLTGVLNGDDVSLTGGSASFQDKNAAGGKAVAATGLGLGGEAAANYSLTATTAGTTAGITRRPLVVTAAGVDKTYDATLTAGVVLSDNHLAGDDVSASCTGAQFADKTAAPGKTVSVSGITISGNDAGNYEPNTTAATTATITERALVVTATGVDKPYDGTTTASVVLSHNHLAGDIVTDGYASALFADKNVGPGKVVTVSGISISGADAGNYTANTTATTTAGITAIVLTVTANDQTRRYGEPNQAFTVRYSGFANTDDAGIVTGSLSFTCLDSHGAAVTPATPAGVFSIVPSGLSAPNYTVVHANGHLTVGKAVLTVAASSATRGYGAANPVFFVTITGFVNGENGGVLTGQPDVSTTADAASPVGSYDIQVQPGSLAAANYSFAVNPGSLSVTPALLTGSIVSAERAYGDTNPVFNVSYAGFVNNQGSNLMAGPLAFSCLDATNGVVDTNTPVGVYPVHVVTPQTAANYSVGYVDGSLTVTQAVLGVAGNHLTRLYGAANPDLTFTITGFVNGEDGSVLGGQPALATTADLASPVGDYDITVGAGGLSAVNYSFSTTNGILTVGKALLTVTADSQTRLYGQVNSALTARYSGFVDGDNESVLGGAPALSTVADVHSGVGSHEIVAAAGNLTAANYALGFVNGSLTVNPAPLTIKANDASRQYGTDNPTFTAVINGFVNGEDAGALTGTLTVTSLADRSTGVGIHDIVPAGVSSLNYDISLVAGALTITPAPLTVTADSALRQYGTPNPVFSGTIAGLLNSDPITAAYDSGATQASPAGVYDIVPGLLDPDGKAGNYAVSLVSGQLTVTVALPPAGTPGLYVIGNAPVLINTNAAASDGGSLSFAGATLAAAIVTNVTADDQMAVAAQGNSPGQINAQSGAVTFGGTTIATLTGGNAGSPLAFVFNANATAASVSALMHQLSFATSNTNTALRVIDFTLSVAGSTLTSREILTLDRQPVAGRDLITVAEGAVVQIPFSQALANDTDLDGDTLVVTACSELSAYGGRVTTNATGFLYSPPAGLTGQDLFAYAVEDGRGGYCVGVIALKCRPQGQIQLDLSNADTTGARLDMACTPGGAYLIQASVNLVDWVNLNTVVADSTGILQVLDADAKNCPNRYYRALAQ